MSKLYKPQYDASHALIVGIDHYMTASPLSFAVNDANAVGGVSDCVEIALGVVSGWWNMTRSGDEIKMH